MKWIQRAVESRSPELETPIRAALPRAMQIEWRSPLREDEFAEYRDGAFLVRLGLDHLVPALADFWPKRGPQWDALAVTDAGHAILVEAKAHIGEFCSPPSQASAGSLALIRLALTGAARELGVSSPDAERWHLRFFQYANRLAHLSWLRRQGVDARLVLVGFCGDHAMPGKTTVEAWQAAYVVANYALGISARTKLLRHVIHVHPDVALLA